MTLILTKFYANSLFCCKYRIYRNTIKLMYFDIIRFYTICNHCAIENIKKLEKMSIEELNKMKDIYSSFISFTEEAKKQIGAMESQLKEPMSDIISFFKVRIVKIQAPHDLLSNIEKYIKAKKELNKTEVEESKAKYVPPEDNEEFNLDDEYNLEEKKEDEFDIGNKGLDDFMTTVKQSATTTNYPYNTTVPPTQPPAQFTTDIFSDEPSATQPSFQPPVQTTPQSAFNPSTQSYQPPKVSVPAKPLDEFDDLFGDAPIARDDVFVPTLAPQNNQPQAQNYDQFASYYNTYQQPGTAPISNMGNQYSQSSYMQQNIPPKADPYQTISQPPTNLYGVPSVPSNYPMQNSYSTPAASQHFGNGQFGNNTQMNQGYTGGSLF